MSTTWSSARSAVRLPSGEQVPRPRRYSAKPMARRKCLVPHRRFSLPAALRRVAGCHLCYRRHAHQPRTWLLEGEAEPGVVGYGAVVNDLKRSANSQGCRGCWAPATLFVPLPPASDFLLRGRPESSLIDQKCNEQTHAVLSANAFNVLASSIVNTSSFEPFLPRHGQSPMQIEGSIF